MDPAKHYYTYSIIQQRMTSNNFVLNFGMDLQIQLKKKLGIILSMDYMTSSASFANGNSLNFKKNINLLNFNIGLNYNLKTL